MRSDSTNRVPTPPWPALLLALALSACSEVEEPLPPVDRATLARPNVILISLDALRADHLGMYGYRRDTSPELDRFAAESVVYERAYCTAAWTLISHLTMLTGLYPSRHGVMDGDAALSPDIPTLAERFAAADYDTLALYYKGWIHRRYGYSRGFRVFEAHDCVAEASENLTWALDSSEKPFFLFVHLFDIHCGDLPDPDSVVYDVPPAYRDLFLPGAAERLKKFSAKDLYYGNEEKPPLKPKVKRALVALYDGGIRYVDTVLGRWFDDWRARGLLDNTIVIITSDHGEGLGQRDGAGLGGHGNMNEEGIHVPLLIRYPDGYRAGARDESLVSHVDLVPTLLDRLGLPVEPWLSGDSLLQPVPPDRPVLAEWDNTLCVIRWPLKLIYNSESGNGVVCDLERDPRELKPITPRTNRKLLGELQAELLGARDALHASRPDLGTSPLSLQEDASEAEKAQLRALGYVDEVD